MPPEVTAKKDLIDLKIKKVSFIVSKLKKPLKCQKKCLKLFGFGFLLVLLVGLVAGSAMVLRRIGRRHWEREHRLGKMKI